MIGPSIGNYTATQLIGSPGIQPRKRSLGDKTIGGFDGPKNVGHRINQPFQPHRGSNSGRIQGHDGVALPSGGKAGAAIELGSSDWVLPTSIESGILGLTDEQ